MTVQEFKQLTDEYFKAAQKFVEGDQNERGVILMTTYEKTGEENSTRGFCCTPIIGVSLISSARKDTALADIFMLADIAEKLG